MNIGGESELPLRHLTSRSSRVIRTGYQRFERPVYDFASKYPPCRAGCPAGHDIAWAAYLAARGRMDLALQAFKEDSPFPAITGRVCYHPCESACNRGEYDKPIAISAIERAFAEYGNGHPVEAAPRVHEESVGIVGAGPAGLTCAYHLVRLGYPVTVYDANDRPGGTLAYGIPAYRLPRETVAAEITSLCSLGVAFRCGVRVGVDLPFADLRRAHHALFLAPGLARARALLLPAPKDAHVESGLAFLRAASTGRAKPLSGSVAVIGGGDVAVDAARTALRLGAEKVTICCAEARDDMPAHPAEVEAACREGIEVLDRVAPQSLAAGTRGILLSLAGVRRVRRTDDGGVAFDLEAEPARVLNVAHLFYAVGQDADLSFLPEPLSHRRRLRVDGWGQTSLPGVFAGGDITGAYSVVSAVGAGKRAAIGIDALLRGLDLEEFEAQIRVGHTGALSMRAYEAARVGQPVSVARHAVRLADINLDYFPPSERARPREADSGARVVSFAEVNAALSPAEAEAEARRCFHCGTCNMCGNCFLYCPDSSVIQLENWGFAIDLDHCKGCGVCVEECPRDAMSMVPEGEGAREGGSR